jgi:hypothetical protein
LVDLAEVKRESGFSYAPQAQRELVSRNVPTDDVLDDLRFFQIAWMNGAPLSELGVRFRFQKVHDAECARRGILLYEIYVLRGKYRAVIAWLDATGPGYWVAVFKKQGNPQSRVSLRTAGERAVNLWRETHG